MRQGKLVGLAMAVVVGGALLVGQSTALPRPISTGSPQPRLAVADQPKAAVESPVRLTASDGTGLELVHYEAKAMVNGPLAFTELHLTFQNPQDRQIEGRFEITMPDKAAISRFAMKINEDWQEAEVVELQKARAAYEDFLHRRQDPALLEKQAGNQFQARVFPIPAKGQKELILSYSQELTAGQDFRLPLAGLPKVGNLSVRASAWQGPDKPNVESKLDLQGEAPSQDFVVARTSPVNGLVQGRLALLQVTPKVSDSSSKLGDLMILVDTSASRSAGYRAQLDKIEGLLEQLALVSPTSKVKIAAFDQEIVEVYAGALPGAKQATRLLRQRQPLGATDLEKALKWSSRQKGFSRLLLVTDGVDTCGTDKLQQSGLDRIDVILCGGIRKPESLTHVAQTQPTRGGLVLDGDKSSARELANSLTRAAVSGVQVEIPGAKWVWPNRLDGLEPGQQRIIYAELANEGQKVEVQLRGPKGFEKQDLSIDLTSVSWPLLARAASAAQISRLSQMLKTCKESQRASILKDIVDLSTKSRVLCDYTALLVLETDQDYARFGIDRTALADILTIGQQGLESIHRNKPFVAPPKTPQVSNQEGRLKLEAGKNQNEAKKDESTIGDLSQAGAKEKGAAGEVDDNRSPGPLAAGSSNRGSEGVMGRDRRSAPSVDVLSRQSGERPSTGLSQTTLTVSDGDGPTRATGVQEVNEPVPPPDQTGRSPRSQSQTEQIPTPRPQREPDQPQVERPPANRLPVSEPPRVPPILTSPTGPAREASWNSAGVSQTPAWEGDYGEVHSLLAERKAEAALAKAWKMHAANPGDLLALVALGESFHANGQDAQAARAFGSIIDLFPGRADLRRYAGCQLEALGQQGEAIALDSYTKAVDQRPDHPSSYRLKAYALVKAQRFQEAFETLEAGLRQNYPGGRFAQAQQVLGEDLAIVGRLWSLKSPTLSKEISARLAKFNLKVADSASTRFVLIWETDANDVDFHILDGHSGHAYYSTPGLPSGGRLYADVTTGYGPECFNIPGGAKAGPYRIGVHYYARGPMGFGMGKVQILRHDGNASLKMEERPYVVMKDGAFVDLGTVTND